MKICILHYKNFPNNTVQGTKQRRCRFLSIWSNLIIEWPMLIPVNWSNVTPQSTPTTKAFLLVGSLCCWFPEWKSCYNRLTGGGEIPDSILNGKPEQYTYRLRHQKHCNGVTSRILKTQLPLCISQMHLCRRQWPVVLKSQSNPEVALHSY